MNITNPVYQTEKHSRLKDTYAFISTENIVNTLASKGWSPVETKIARVNNPARDGFQRHIVRFEHPAFPSIPGLSETNASRPQLVVVNSHDGGTATRFMLGLIRLACLNGIIAGTSLREFRTIHSGNITPKIEQGLEFLTAGLPDMFQQIQMLQQTTFSESNLDALVKTLVSERLKNSRAVEVDYSSVLQVRRSADNNSDAFTVFNRLQESLMRGGIRYTAEKSILDQDGNVVSTELQHKVTRKLNSIPQAVKLNRIAYDMAVKLAA